MALPRWKLTQVSIDLRVLSELRENELCFIGEKVTDILENKKVAIAFPECTFNSLWHVHN